MQHWRVAGRSICPTGREVTLDLARLSISATGALPMEGIVYDQQQRPRSLYSEETCWISLVFLLDSNGGLIEARQESCEEDVWT